MDESNGIASSAPSKQERWDRLQSTERLAGFAGGGPELSQREFARRSGVPRSTLQYWLSRKEKLDEDPLVQNFLESPQGLAILHRIVAAAHISFGEVGPCGVRQVSLFLHLSGLNRVVASSVGSQQAVARRVEELIVEYGLSERERLAQQMPFKSISACQDETFHPQICLVAIEPVSNFLLLERYSEHRDEASWTEAMKQATEGLNVKIVQAVSDEAKGLLSHAKDGLGAHHGPDLFHTQQDLVKATAAPLCRAVARAEERLEKAQAQMQRLGERAEQSQEQSAEPAQQPDEALQERIDAARAAKQQAASALEQAQMLRTEAKAAIQAVGQCYHPVSLQDGHLRSAEQLHSELTEQFDRVEGAALVGGLSEASRGRIAKARRLIPSMVATLSFFWLQLRLVLEGLALDAQLESIVLQSLLPGLYLQKFASKAPGAERRAFLHRKAQEILAPCRAPDGPLAALPKQRQESIEQAIAGCIELFVRSSSCVEGRNGQLALRHHSLHRLSSRKLNVLTTIHNYFLRRSDGTTAAERFFGSKPKDLFAWVLDRLQIPARPARARPALKQAA
jgi:hypothetical protein